MIINLTGKAAVIIRNPQSNVIFLFLKYVG